MKRIFLAVFFAAALSGAVRAEQWMLDKSHSLVGFTVKHMMVTNTRGEFTEYDATVDFDPANPASMKINATIDVNSISTRNEQRDGHLKSADFFDAANHPKMTFVSKKAVKAADGTIKLTGDLTIRGTTKEVTLDLTGFDKVYDDPWGSSRLGGTVSGIINRKDFGLTWNAALETGGVVVGEEVTINIEIELMQKKS